MRHTSFQRLEYTVIENSSAGLVMVRAEVAVTVTHEEHHQAALARYTVPEGMQRSVAVELGWCTVSSGKYRGEPAIEVSLDGQRVGELTRLMSQRYAPVVSQVASRGGRPGCEAEIQLGPRGLEVVLRLPRDASGVIPIPMPAPAPMSTLPVSAAPQQRRASRRPAWIAAAAVIGVIFVVAVANSRDVTPTAAQSSSSTSATTKTTAPLTTSTKATTTSATTTTTTTTTAAPVPVPPVAPPPVPKPVAPAPPPLPAPVEPAPAPAPTCDPNYSGCVPIASDVDCQGGSGNGPAYVRGPVQVIGNDIYGLDNDKDGIGCE